jgi:1-acyl-sn-glycerol-3-phosphate acyltransferase
MMQENERAKPLPFTKQSGLLSRIWGLAGTAAAVLITFILCLPAALAAALNRDHWVSPLMRLWAWLVFAVCGIKAEVRGLEHLRGVQPCIFVMNHQSLFDIPAMVRLIPLETRFVAKRELTRVPLMGYVLARSGNVVIDRESGGRAIRHAMKAIRSGYSICVFAEGHRYSDNRVHEFSDGAAWLALATKQPCVPVAISGTIMLAPRGAKAVQPGKRIRLAIGAPIATDGMRSRDREELTSKLEQSVREMFSANV